MKLLADENIDSPIVHWLRSQSHDVVWIAEISPGTHDEAVIQLAASEHRFFLTRDLDFGELIFRRSVRVAGVALIRLPGRTVEIRLQLFQRSWPEIEEHISGNFLVASVGRTRIRPLPQA